MSKLLPTGHRYVLAGCNYHQVFCDNGNVYGIDGCRVNHDDDSKDADKIASVGRYFNPPRREVSYEEAAQFLYNKKHIVYVQYLVPHLNDPLFFSIKDDVITEHYARCSMTSIQSDPSVLHDAVKNGHAKYLSHTEVCFLTGDLPKIGKYEVKIKDKELHIGCKHVTREEIEHCKNAVSFLKDFSGKMGVPVRITQANIKFGSGDNTVAPEYIDKLLDLTSK